MISLFKDHLKIIQSLSINKKFAGGTTHQKHQVSLNIYMNYRFRVNYTLHQVIIELKNWSYTKRWYNFCQMLLKVEISLQ